jgi:hypothetical protein
MLGKLLKYEFKALLRIIPAIYLALLALATVTGVNRLIARVGAERVTGQYEAGWSWGWSVTNTLEIALVMMCFALFIVCVVIVILRFKDNFLKDEGYLMFTLPVTERELVASKAIAGFCSFLLTAVVVVLAMLIYGFIANYRDMLEQLSRFFRDWNETFNIGPDQQILWVLITVVFVFQQICLAYASMMVSQMAPRFRGIIGFGVYLGVMILAERLSNVVLTGSGVPYLLESLLYISAFAAFCFWGTGWLLKHTFNLE